jgi:hypothetical protein
MAGCDAAADDRSGNWAMMAMLLPLGSAQWRGAKVVVVLFT